MKCLGVILALFAYFSALSATGAVNSSGVCGQGYFTLDQVMIVDENDVPLKGVAVRVKLDGSHSRYVTIFSGEDGRLAASDLTHKCHEPGTAKQSGVDFIGRGYGLETVGRSTKGGHILVEMSREALVPRDLPAAAWVQHWPQTKEARIVTVQCVQCHQLPGRPTWRYSSAVGSIQDKDTRTQVWHGLIDDMRMLSARVTSRKSRPRFTEVGESWRTGRDAFLSDRLKDIIAPFLAEHMPTDFARVAWDPAWDMGDAQATQGVKIAEFRFRAEVNSWFREVAYSPKTGTVIGVDLGGDRVYELYPNSGLRRWIDIPVDAKHTAPHTINVDADGFIWITLEDINGVGKYDPVERAWTIYRDIFNGNKISHDFATNSQGHVAKDLDGRIWISLVSHNHLAALDPETGESEEFTLPPRHDGLREPTLPYGVVMTSDRRFVWLSQHASDALLKISTETGEVVETIQFPESYGPRRMSIDGQDRVWLAMSGRSALTLIEDDEVKKEYLLPMDLSYPYNTLWDPDRRSVWVGTSNAGELLEFDPSSEKFSRYALPAHSESYIRQFSRDPVTGHIWTAYASKLGENAEVAVVRVTPESR